MTAASNSGKVGERTPGPLTLTSQPFASWIGAIGNNLDDPQLWSAVTPYPKGTKQADAAFIVTAWNAHDGLVKALEAMLVDPPSTLDEPDSDAEVIRKLRTIARTALSQLTTQSSETEGK